MRKCGRERLANRYGFKKGERRHLSWHWNEIKSNNRFVPQGYEKDWKRANYDIFVHEKQYCYYKNVHDGYDARIEKKLFLWQVSYIKGWLRVIKKSRTHGTVPKND